jgi:hypothetical protein
MPLANNFGAGNANGGSFMGMKDLIQEYETVDINSLKDLKARYSMKEIGTKLC